MSVTLSATREMHGLRNTCPACAAGMEPFAEFSRVPVNSCILMVTREEALAYPRGDVVLGVCHSCGFICNLAFDQGLAEYSGRYEETQGYSPTFREFHARLAQDLIDRHGVRNKDILEIGCGKGEFLALICKLGENRGLGFDPSYDKQRSVLRDVPNAEVICDFYSEVYAGSQADLVCCKMTLEHIPETARFVRLARRAMRSGSVLYFLVPEAMRIIRDCAFEDVYYEHCCYFTAGSLARLFRAQGLEVLRVGTEYAGQYLAIEASLAAGPTRPSLDEEDDLEAIRDLVRSFPERCARALEHWRHLITQAATRGSVVLWGSGSKAVAFLHAADTEGAIDTVVDINPNKHGHFMPGTGQPIVAPAALTRTPPATVIVMNPIYETEITGELHGLGLYPDVHTL